MVLTEKRAFPLHKVADDDDFLTLPHSPSPRPRDTLKKRPDEKQVHRNVDRSTNTQGVDSRYYVYRLISLAC